MSATNKEVKGCFKANYEIRGMVMELIKGLPYCDPDMIIISLFFCPICLRGVRARISPYNPIEYDASLERAVIDPDSLPNVRKPNSNKHIASDGRIKQ